MLFCPRCGDRLVDIQGELTCVAGGMGLSKVMASRLTDCYVSKSRRPSERDIAFPDIAFRWGGEWYCPGCGVRAQEFARGRIVCPNCQSCMSEFIYELVEFHPHAAPKV